MAVSNAASYEQMSAETYSATSGRMAAAYDIREGRPNDHRDASGAAAYRLAYDCAISAHERRKAAR